ncbi:MAG: serpin family protein [Longimicrobiales bacterium]
MRARAWQAVLSVAVAGFLLGGCGSDATGPSDRPEPITELPRALTATERDLLDAGTRFGLDLLGVLAPAHRQENLFFSPLSASMALGMTLNGADGATFDQMAATLGYGGLPQAEINAAYATLLELLQDVDPDVTVSIANAIWFRQGTPFDPTFVARVQDAFDAEVAAVDFAAPATLDRINRWVEEQTGGTIPKLYDALPAGLVSLLANAVYFEGGWTDRFDPDRTRPGAFATGGGEVQADFMSRRGVVAYREAADHQVVELPYGGQAWAMTLLLPGEGTDAADLVAGLDPVAWSALVDGLGEREIVVELPRFELAWERRLNDDLQALGMIDAFDPGRADLSRMIPGGGVWIDEVKQKSFVKVDEEGTVAAAVTGVTVVESLPTTVRFDRPFVLAIRERLSGTLLFLGVVRDPTG